MKDNIETPSNNGIKKEKYCTIGTDGKYYRTGVVTKMLLGMFTRKNKHSSSLPMAHSIKDISHFLKYKKKVYLPDIAIRGIIERGMMGRGSKGFITKLVRGKTVYYYKEYRYQRAKSWQ